MKKITLVLGLLVITASASFAFDGKKACCKKDAKCTKESACCKDKKNCTKSCAKDAKAKNASATASDKPTATAAPASVK